MMRQDVIDGDICEMYGSLEYARQKRIAEELDRTPADVLRRLEEMRNRLL